MEREEKIRRLVERLNVTPEEAAAALDGAGGDLLDAALRLEQSKSAGDRTVQTHSTAAAAPETEPDAEEPKAQASAGDRAGEIILALVIGLVTHPILNGVRLEQKGGQTATVPAVVLLALLLVRWWVVPVLFAVGLLAGWKFKWTGPQWDNASLNTAWAVLESKAAGLRESMKGGHHRG